MSFIAKFKFISFFFRATYFCINIYELYSTVLIVLILKKKSTTKNVSYKKKTFKFLISLYTISHLSHQRDVTLKRTIQSRLSARTKRTTYKGVGSPALQPARPTNPFGWQSLIRAHNECTPQTLQCSEWKKGCTGRYGAPSLFRSHLRPTLSRDSHTFSFAEWVRLNDWIRVFVLAAKRVETLFS